MINVRKPHSINQNYLELAPNLVVDPDVLLSNGNGIFCAGTQGTGKTIIAKLIMEQIAQKVFAPIVAFDKEEDLKSVIKFFPRGIIGTFRNCPTAQDIYGDGLQVVYDLSTWPNMDMAGSMIARTVRQLMREANTTPFHLRVPSLVVLDEASYWLPQNRKISSLADETLSSLHNAFEALASRGRKRGLVPTLFTQKFSHIAKDVLSPGTYILMKQIVHTEQQRYLDYILPVSEFRYFTDRQKRQRVADLVPGEAIVKLATGEQIVALLNECQSEHVAHTPTSQAARNRYEHLKFEQKTYGSYIEDDEEEEQQIVAAPQEATPLATTENALSKNERVRRILLAPGGMDMKQTDIARIVDCHLSVVSRQRAKLLNSQQQQS
jgi:hypothetical protein